MISPQAASVPGSLMDRVIWPAALGFLRSVLYEQPGYSIVSGGPGWAAVGKGKGGAEGG